MEVNYKVWYILLTRLEDLVVFIMQIMRIIQKNMEQLIKEIEALESKLSALRSQLHEHTDGFLYLTCLCSYGSVNWQTHNNEYTVQELCNEYDGYDGIVNVYTTNPNSSISNYGEVSVMTLDEIQNISKDNISMSRAITNWITKGI